MLCSKDSQKMYYTRLLGHPWTEDTFYTKDISLGSKMY